ncbi:PiggyBac transposable element-derived protein 3 [Trichinella nelsoni]|uniref:PiggyBac transposable element-derived protein 3 n=1 Tax=Trichinella nelsoni TaxID=6336 RepID=A0A0V0S607_9BILA|nr:PiggyBac transposable element-derived protein 3 [Trichinella nelsoni]
MQTVVYISHMPATGTVRNARIRNCPLMKTEIILKKSRGYYEHACDGEIYSKAEKKHVDITEPNIIRQYNKYMGSVDVMNKVLSSYRPKFRSRKWW